MENDVTDQDGDAASTGGVCDSIHTGSEQVARSVAPDLIRHFDGLMATFRTQQQEGAPLDTLFKHDLQYFFRELAQAHQSALLLDYDGTLAPFRQNRHEAFPYPGVAPLLKEIMATDRTRLVLITGRCAHELIALLDVFPHPEIWGTHGLERLRADGSREMGPIDQYTLEALSAADEWVNGLAGC